MARTKGRRRSSRQKLDRLSDLPDFIVHEIFSFLDINQAIKTCELSKRWKRIWRSLPDLNLYHYAFYLDHNFTQYVNKLLSTRDDCRVRKLCFSFQWNLEDSLFYKVVDYAVSHHVQHLKLLNVGSCAFFSLSPTVLLTCKSLQTLKLSQFKFEDLTKSFAFGLPNLTSLTLFKCSFHYQSDLGDPFASCPNLKNLVLQFCRFPSLKILKISGLQLLSLEILGFFYSHSSILPTGCKVEIFAPKLASFSYRESEAVDFSRLRLPSLNHVHLALQPPIILRDQESDHLRCLINMLQGLDNAQFVRLHHETIKALNDAPAGFLERQTSPFKRLKSLKLQREYPLDTVPTHVMTYLLGGTPHPETINVDYINT